MSTVEFHCPKCKKRVSLEESLAGHASTCPHCQEWLKVPDASQLELTAAEVPRTPKAPAPLLDALVEQEIEPALSPVDTDRGHDHPRGSVALGGWSCLMIALVLMVFVRPAFFVYLPLVVVAFVLGIVTMAKGHVFHGQLLLIGTLVLPVLVAMKFLGVELSQIPHLDQWVQMPSEEPAEISEGISKGVEEADELEAAMEAESWIVERDEWDLQETPMEETITEVENDWDQTMPDQEPNWEEKEDYWTDQFRRRFVAPQAGMYVKLKLRTGGGAEGTLRAVGPDAVTLQVPRGWVTYEKDRMSAESRRQFFAEDFAQYYAARKVQSDRTQYRSRRDQNGDELSSRL